jgi:hypothetical protein
MLLPRTSLASLPLAHLPRRPTGRKFSWVRVSVPYPLVRPGDVIEDLGCLAVVTHALMAEEGKAGRIQAVCEDGQQHETVYPPRTTTGLFSRVAEGCVPSAAGLHDFLAQHPPE